LKLFVDTIPGWNSVACGLFLPVGSCHEKVNQLGLSHFLEHLVFKGTGKRSAKDIALEMDSTGGDLNAYTSVEYTSFYAKVLKGDLNLALDILFDLAFNPKLTLDAIELERGVVLSEIAEYLDAPDEIAGVRAFQAAWGDHPLARPVLGSQEVIRTVSADEVRDYHAKYYIKDKAFISVCGGITFDEMSALLSKMDGSVKELSGRPMNLGKPPIFKPRKLAMERDSEQVYFTYCWPGPPLGAHGVALSLVLSVILSGSTSSRLFQRLREQEGLVYNISILSSMSTNSGLIGVYGATQNKNFEKSRKILEEEIHLLRNKGVSGDELNRAKRMIKGSTSLSLESNIARMERAGKLGLLLGKVSPIDEVINKIEKIELENFNDYLMKNIPEDWAVSIVGKGLKELESFEVE